jgi:SAM-dependent methyltransferase
VSYTERWFEGTTATAVASARRVLALVAPVVGELHSAIDVGCGEGAWLAEAHRLGATRVVGVDGYADPAHFLLPSHHLVRWNLEHPECYPRGPKFDLVMCLEVAEHLSARAAEPLVDLLCALGDLVLFSAAIPLQGGEGHINEQWPAYWWDLFLARGFIGSHKLRWDVWNDAEIAWFYRQNAMVFMRYGRPLTAASTEWFFHSAFAVYTQSPPMPVFHPEWAIAKSGLNLR